MSDACTELDARLEAVASAAAPLPSRLPRVRDPVLGRWMAHQMDALLRNVTAGYGALDVAIGEGLDALNVGRRAMDLLQHRRLRPGRARDQREHGGEDGAAGAKAPRPAALERSGPARGGGRPQGGDRRAGGDGR